MEVGGCSWLVPGTAAIVAGLFAGQIHLERLGLGASGGATTFHRDLRQTPDRYQQSSLSRFLTGRRVGSLAGSGRHDPGAWADPGRVVLVNVNNLLPILDEHGLYDLRTYIVAGARDEYCHGVARQLADLLPKYGIACQLDVYPDMEHQFPLDFERKLPEPLDYVMSGSPIGEG